MPETNVVDGIGKDQSFRCMEGGVRVDASDCIILQSKVDANGQLIEGHIYAPGHCCEVTFWKEKE